MDVSEAAWRFEGWLNDGTIKKRMNPDSVQPPPSSRIIQVRKLTKVDTTYV